MILQLDEQRRLIEQAVRANPKLSGNEDLFEDFCNEAFQKSYIIFNSATNIKKVESYVAKVVNTSIVAVLKDSGRVHRVHNDYVPTKTVQFEPVKTKTPVFSMADSAPSFEYDVDDYKPSPEDIAVKKELLQQIADTVCILHKDNPKKCFFEIFVCRYVKGMKQRQIAEELNLSQSEVSKRLFDLLKLVKKHLQQD